MTSDMDIAERLTVRRARMLPAFALLSLTQQTVFLSGGGARPVEGIKVGAWAALTATLLVLLATGGGLLRSRAVRALLNDETTRLHRMRACATGLWASMLCGIAVYLLAQVVEVTAREAIHIVVTAGLSAALLGFAMQERRAFR